MADASNVPTTGLELYLNFDDEDLTDESGNARDQSSVQGAEEYVLADGAPSSTDAYELSTYNHNGIDTGVTAYGDCNLFATSGVAWSAALWARFTGTSTGGFGPLLSRGHFVTADFPTLPTFMLQVPNPIQNTDLTLTLRGSSSNYEVNWADEEWHHVVVIWDGTDASVYIDGAAKAAPSIGALANSTDNIRIGHTRQPQSFGPGFFQTAQAQIDDFRLYSRALNANEVALLFDYGAPVGSGSGGSGTVQPVDLEMLLEFEDDLTDSSVNANDQTSNESGDIEFVSGKIGSKGAYFDGTTPDWINTGLTTIGDATLFADSGDGPFSVAFWVKYDDVSGEGGHVWARDKSDNTGVETFFDMNPRAATPNADVRIRGTTSTITLTDVDDGNWHHLALTYDGTSTMTLYYDGADVGNPTIGSAAKSADPALTIGARLGIGGAAQNPYKGYLDDFRIYSRELSSSDVGEIIDAQPDFSVTLSLTSLVAEVATVTAEFGRDINASTFISGDITVTNGTITSGPTSVDADTYTFEVTASDSGTVTVSIAAETIEDDDGGDNLASNVLSWGVGGVGADGDGIARFDRTASRVGQTASIIIGPVSMSPSVARQARLDNAVTVLGSGTDATGTFNFSAGRTGEDAVRRVEADEPQYSSTVTTLLANNGVCYPKVMGSAMVVEIDVTSGHLVFEQQELTFMEAGKSRLNSYS